MFDRLKSKTAVATTASLIAALGVGGVAVAQNSGNSTPAQKASPVVKVKSHKKASKKASKKSATAAPNATENPSGPDGDTVQSGDQSTPDTGSSSEAPGTETSDSSSGEQPGSEVSNNDGPGGHADEPGNANADHQAQGVE
jgi:hypothetical protein